MDANDLEKESSDELMDNCSELSDEDFDPKKMEFIQIKGDEVRNDDYFSIEEEKCICPVTESPIESFFLFFDKELFEQIAQSSNSFAQEKYNQKTNFTYIDIQNYIFTFIYSSVIQLPEIEDYWKKSNYVSTIIPKIYTLYKYRQINKYFHLSYISEKEKHNQPLNNEEKLEKINSFIHYINKKFQENYEYSKYITIDESMASFRGRIIFRQYCKDKRNKFGIKFFTKASSLKHYVYELLPYTGKTFEYNKSIGIGAHVLEYFIKPHKNKNTHFTFDNYYGTMKGIELCSKSNINFTCTWSQNKKGFPTFLKTIQIKEKGIYEAYKSGNIIFLVYKDKRQIQLASNSFSIRTIKYKNKRGIEKKKPEMIAAYNLTKAGVDLVDGMAGIYSCKRKTYKWWKTVFFYLLDIIINNASIIYYSKNTSKRTNMHYFREKLFEAYFSEFIFPKEIKTITKNELHYPIFTNKVRECYLCKYSEEGRPKRTSIMCANCEVFFCKECFTSFHEGF